jgi:hypothetical protein
MDATSLRAKLIMYKTYGHLNDELVKEIQDELIHSTKESDFEKLLKKVEDEMNSNKPSQSQIFDNPPSTGKSKK